mgnify:FL=1
MASTSNEAFARDAPDGPGYSIAKIYDIEVTTPPFDGVLRGRRKFDSYRGFDVVVEHYEKNKSKKNGSVEVGVEEPRKFKTSEGKLVSRDKEADGNTTINSKGRAVKIKNEGSVNCICSIATTTPTTIMMMNTTKGQRGHHNDDDYNNRRIHQRSRGETHHGCGSIDVWGRCGSMWIEQ